MSARRDALARWTAVVAWAAIIFVASLDWFSEQRTEPVVRSLIVRLFPHVGTEAIETANAVVRKLGHLVEYAVLCWLLTRALDDGRGWQLRRAVLAVALTAAYALTDELHQHFVRGRTASLGDVLIDVLGATSMQMTLAAWRHRSDPRMF